VMKRLTLQLGRRCGLFSVARAISGNMARILMYHNFCGAGEIENGAIDANLLREQFSLLDRHFRVVPLLELVEHLQPGSSPGRNSVVLTIDDGRRNFYQFAFPLLKQFRFPATLFVVSSFIGAKEWIWTDKVLWLSEQPHRASELAKPSLDALFKALNRLSPAERDARISAMAAEGGVQVPREPLGKFAPCSWDELREMTDSGLVRIGSHTKTHPILSSISDTESCRELNESRAEIERGIKGKAISFCFPNGSLEDYRPSQVRQIAEAGYTCAVTAVTGLVHERADRYQLPRIGVGPEADRLGFSKMLDGVSHYQQKVARAMRQGSGTISQLDRGRI
jgi:peptidoglycan/xylan/chitin deacetylase (PgdA/CDA1 family)